LQVRSKGTHVLRHYVVQDIAATRLQCTCSSRVLTLP
jgi:hypothetical protein